MRFRGRYRDGSLAERGGIEAHCTVRNPLSMALDDLANSFFLALYFFSSGDLLPKVVDAI